MRLCICAIVCDAIFSPLMCVILQLLKYKCFGWLENQGRLGLNSGVVVIVRRFAFRIENRRSFAP